MIGLHTLERARTTLLLGGGRGALGFVAALAGAAIADIEGAAWGLALAEGLTGLAYVAALRSWGGRVSDWATELSATTDAGSSSASAARYG